MQRSAGSGGAIYRRRQLTSCQSANQSTIYIFTSMIAVTTLVWFFVTILMMGFFAGIEMAFYSANRFGIELKKKQGRHSAVMLSRLIENPQLFLSTTLDRKRTRLN